MALVCDYCGDVTEAAERIDVAFGHNQEIALKGATAKEWFYYCEGECSDKVRAMLSNLRLFAMHGEGSGLVWQLVEQAVAPEVDEVKPVSEKSVEATTPKPVGEETDVGIPDDDSVDGLDGFLCDYGEKVAEKSRKVRREDGQPLNEIIEHAGTLSYLSRANLLTLEDARELSEAELMAIHGVGVKVVRQVNAALAKEGERLDAGPEPKRLGRTIQAKATAQDLSSEQLAAAIADTLGIPPKVRKKNWTDDEWRYKTIRPDALRRLEFSVEGAFNGREIPPPILLGLIAAQLGTTRETLISASSAPLHTPEPA